MSFNRADLLYPIETVRTWGFNDSRVGLVSGIGSFGSGLIFTALGFGIMTLIGTLIAHLLLIVSLIWLKG